MTNLNDYLTAGKNALKQRRPPAEANEQRSPAAERGAAPPSSAPRFHSLGPERRTPSENWPPTLDTLLTQIGDLPDYSVLLGIGEDRLPFHLDLTNPASGAVLVCAEAGTEATVLLRSILGSAIALNRPQDITLSVIAHQVDDYMNFASAEHCQEILPADEDIVGEFVIELAEIVEERRSGSRPDPAIVLFIDDLAECIEFLGEQAYARLYWLIRHGPRYRVWTFATLPSGRAHLVGERFLSAFRTRLIGRIKDNRLTTELAQDPALRAGSLPAGQFYLPYGSEWLRFWACPVDGAGDSE